MKHFDEFWKIYPRKVAKGTARKAWTKAIKAAAPEAIIKALRGQIAAGAFKEATYTPYPATWLNGERWDDEILPPQPTATQVAARTGNRPDHDFMAVQLREALADAIESGDAEFEARVRSEAAKEGVELK
jgi:hypothetical protein